MRTFILLIFFNLIPLCALSEINPERSTHNFLMEYSAVLQYYADQNRLNPTSSEYFERAKEVLLAAYHNLENSESLKDDTCLRAYTYSRVGWFFLNSPVKTDLVNPIDLVKNAHVLCPSDPVYAYQYAFLLDDFNEKIALFRKIVAEHPGFFEGHFQLSLITKDLDEYSIHRRLSHENIKNFRPELHNFDHSFPSRYAHIIIGPNQRLERTKYHDQFDRFKFDANRRKCE